MQRCTPAKTRFIFTLTSIHLFAGVHLQTTENRSVPKGAGTAARVLKRSNYGAALSGSSDEMLGAWSINYLASISTSQSVVHGDRSRKSYAHPILLPCMAT
jgi:hypothetical protein